MIDSPVNHVFIAHDKRAQKSNQPRVYTKAYIDDWDARVGVPGGEKLTIIEGIDVLLKHILVHFSRRHALDA